MKINNPHDTAFKNIFSHKEHTKELMEICLPRELINTFFWDSLRYEQKDFVDNDLKEYYSDMLFSIKTSQYLSLKIYILFEHKSYKDKKIHIQLLQYLSKIYASMDNLTPVIPIVFYHGKDSWNIPVKFSALFNIQKETKELYLKYLPDFSYEIIDLHEKKIEKMIISLTLKSILYTFKHIWEFEDIGRLKEFLILSRDLFFEDGGIKTIETLLFYLYNVNNIEPDNVRTLIEEIISKEKGDIAMTTAEKLIKQGIEQGIEQGKIEDTRKMLEKGFDVKDISDITGLSTEIIEKIRQEMK